jgi:hypothetical protein
VALEGICLAFDDDTLAETPTWTRLDNGVTRVASYTIDRGRQFELDQTDGGRAEIQISDVDGTLDPTNALGTYYGKIEPLLQAGIARWNPVLEEWQTRFRGFVAEYDYDFDPSQRVNRLTLSLVDIFEILNAIEMQPGQFGDTPPAEVAGQVFFDDANVDDRILQIYGDAGIPAGFYVTFSGNVGLYEATYSPGEPSLTPIQEAADAEFPGVSNYYPDRFGRACFHGRLAKFDPVGTAATTTTDRWDFQQWHAGDGAAVAASPSTMAHIRQFSFNRGLSKIFNQALATPVGIKDSDVAGQLVQDLTSIGLRGIRSWPSRQNLLTRTGLLDGSTALVETKRFATYVVDNYADPRDRVTLLGFRPMRPDATGAAANWKLLSQVDIADQINITVASPGGGGFTDEPFFVEGVHEQVDGRIRQGVASDAEGYDNVTLTLDVSPMAYFDTNPFPTS